MTTLSRLLYIDDSGNPHSGTMVYAWVECEPAHWRHELRSWLEFRKGLLAEFDISVTQELHTTKYANGRTEITNNPPDRFIDPHNLGTVFWKDLGREVAALCLEQLRSMQHIKVGAVYRRTQDRGRAYHLAKGALYADLVREIDDEHRRRGDYVLIGMDGDGTDPTYFEAHRSISLDTRHIIEDPMFHDSSRSQWTQMADLVAYAAYLAVERTPTKEFAWDWYRDYFAGKDANGQPRLI